MTESTLLRATRWLEQAQAEVRRLETIRARDGYGDNMPMLQSARANVVARRAEVARLEAETERA